MKIKIKNAKILQQKLKEDVDFNSAALTIYTPSEIEYIKNYRTIWQKIIAAKKTRTILFYLFMTAFITTMVILFSISIFNEDIPRESDRMERILGIE